MNLQYRIDILARLGLYIQSTEEKWMAAKERASRENGWFTPEFVDLSLEHIATNYLAKPKLEKWVSKYNLANENNDPRIVGIVMAGNIPLVGFHDLLTVFISGHKGWVKLSSRDNILIPHLVDRLREWAATDGETVAIDFAELLRGCDAYIATGSNNSASHFEYYFRNHPHIIRRNRTSVAVLTGDETPEELGLLADDVYQYFGLGCRNVTKIYVPEAYDFIPLLTAFRKYNYLSDHHKFRNNYDYNLAIHILNKKYYMSNESLLVVENPSLFSPIGQLHYETYADIAGVKKALTANPDIQCIVGRDHVPFGAAQYPGLDDYADGIDTFSFLSTLTPRSEMAK